MLKGALFTAMLIYQDPWKADMPAARHPHTRWMLIALLLIAMHCVQQLICWRPSHSVSFASKHTPDLLNLQEASQWHLIDGL